MYKKNLKLKIKMFLYITIKITNKTTKNKIKKIKKIKKWRQMRK